MTTPSRPELGTLQVLAFKSSAAFRAWLDANHAQPHGIWLRIFKRNSGKPTITYAEMARGEKCHP